MASAIARRLFKLLHDLGEFLRPVEVRDRYAPTTFRTTRS